MKLYLFLLFTSLSLTGFSQQKADSLSNATKRRAEHDQFVRNIILQQSSNNKVAAKPTGSGQRLLAASITRSGILKDSIAYTWSGNRETVHSTTPDELYSGGRNYYPFSLQLNFHPYIGNRYYRQKPDSVKRYSDHGNGFSLQQTDVNIYNSNDELIKSEQYIYPSGFGSYLNVVYGVAGEVIQVDQYYENGQAGSGNYVHSQALYCGYNSTGKLIKDSLIDIPMNRATIHEYFQNASGEDTLILVNFIDLNTGTISNYLKCFFEYHANGLVKSFKTYDAASMLPVSADSFVYTGTNTYPTYHRLTIYSFVGDVSICEDQFTTFDANGYLQGKLTTSYNTVFNTWDTSSRQSVTYNSFNNPVLVIEDDYLFGWHNNVEQKRFYYQNFTGVKEVPASISLSLFPNPSQSIVNLQVGARDRAVVTVTDVQGRVMQQYAMRSNSLKLNLERLPAGNYVIQYKSDKAVGTAQIVKQ